VMNPPSDMTCQNCCNRSGRMKIEYSATDNTQSVRVAITARTQDPSCETARCLAGNLPGMWSRSVNASQRSSCWATAAMSLRGKPTRGGPVHGRTLRTEDAEAALSHVTTRVSSSRSTSQTAAPRDPVPLPLPRSSDPDPLDEHPNGMNHMESRMLRNGHVRFGGRAGLCPEFRRTEGSSVGTQGCSCSVGSSDPWVRGSSRGWCCSAGVSRS